MVPVMNEYRGNGSFGLRPKGVYIEYMRDKRGRETLE